MLTRVRAAYKNPLVISSAYAAGKSVKIPYASTPIIAKHSSKIISFAFIQSSTLLRGCGHPLKQLHPNIINYNINSRNQQQCYER